MKLDQRMIIRVSGTPRAQPRTKATTINGHTRMYTPDPKGKLRLWKELIWVDTVETMADCQWQEVPKRTPVFVACEFHFHRPSGFRKTDQLKYTKPDKDNLEKAVLDVLGDAGVFYDDGQVVGGPVWKLLDDDWEGVVILVCTGKYIFEQFTPLQTNA